MNLELQVHEPNQKKPHCMRMLHGKHKHQHSHHSSQKKHGHQSVPTLALKFDFKSWS